MNTVRTMHKWLKKIMNFSRECDDSQNVLILSTDNTEDWFTEDEDDNLPPLPAAKKRPLTLYPDIQQTPKRRATSDTEEKLLSLPEDEEKCTTNQLEIAEMEQSKINTTPSQGLETVSNNLAELTEKETGDLISYHEKTQESFDEDLNMYNKDTLLYEKALYTGGISLPECEIIDTTFSSMLPNVSSSMHNVGIQNGVNAMSSNHIAKDLLDHFSIDLPFEHLMAMRILSERTGNPFVDITQQQQEDNEELEFVANIQPGQEPTASQNFVEPASLIDNEPQMN